jgi:hypothetical protein
MRIQIVGGKIPNSKITAAGEIRGPTIEGGAPSRLSPDDIVHIPAKTPHQVLFDPGTTEFDAFVLKIKQ